MRDGEVEGGEGEHSVVYDILHASHRDVVLVYLLAIHQAGRHLAGVLLLVLFFGDRERWVGSAQLLLVLPRLGETGGYAATKAGRRLLPKKTRIINTVFFTPTVAHSIATFLFCGLQKLKMYSLQKSTM